MMSGFCFDAAQSTPGTLSCTNFIYISKGTSCIKRVLANRSLYEYSKSCLVNRLWVPIIV
jgi:hypothetical protein